MWGVKARGGGGEAGEEERGEAIAGLGSRRCRRAQAQTNCDLEQAGSRHVCSQTWLHVAQIGQPGAEHTTKPRLCPRLASALCPAALKSTPPPQNPSLPRTPSTHPDLQEAVARLGDAAGEGAIRRHAAESIQQGVPWHAVVVEGQLAVVHAVAAHLVAHVLNGDAGAGLHVRAADPAGTAHAERVSSLVTTAVTDER